MFVEFHGWYENRHEVFFAMEYIKYGDLSQYIIDRDTAKAEASEVTRQILEGLKILHGEGICHRDLKPQVWLRESLIFIIDAYRVYLSATRIYPLQVN